MLDVFITSRVRRKIIVVYAKYPDFKTHVRGLAKLIKEEAWFPFPNFEGLYEYSNMLRIKSLERKVVATDGVVYTFKEKIMKITKPPHGYAYVTLIKNGKYKIFKV